MISCRNCGHAIPDTAAVCPNCGVAVSAAIPEQPSSYYPPQQGYTPPQQEYPSQQQGYISPQQGYMPPQGGYAPQQQAYMPPQQNYGYQQQQYGTPMYQQPGVNVTVVNNPGATKNTTPLIVEILLSLFLGVYGVGWLMSGETTVGVVLLICSFVIYWPLLIAIAVFTLGFGLICDFPLAIAAIVINAILLNSALNRKLAQQITVVQTR